MTPDKVGAKARAEGQGAAEAGHGGRPAARPLYVQVKELMRARLSEGSWKPGRILPSEFELAAEFGVSQGTVRKALDELAVERLVVRRQGKGTFVAEHDEDRALFHFLKLLADDGGRALPESRVLGVKVARANAAERAVLALEEGAKVWRIDRLRQLSGRPAILEQVAAPEALFPGLGKEEPVPNTLYRLYEARYGVTVARAEERLKAVAASAAEAQALDIVPGAPLLAIDRIAFAIDGRPVEWRRSLCLTDRHHYLVELV